jgi:hypothetical protein
VTSPAPSKDAEDELRAFVHDVEHGFNSNDAPPSIAHFAQDATAVSLNGARIDGRPAMLEANRLA